MSIRVRFAPSPTGHLHIGGARTALYNYAFARANGGTFVLRVEDTDLERSNAEFEKEQIQDLEWLGIDYDEGPGRPGEFGPYRQSERTALYLEVAQRLVDEGLAYYCFCTDEELEAMKERASAEGRPPHYDGKWRNPEFFEEAASKLASGEKATIRFRAPEKSFVLHDEVRGRVVFPENMVGDFVLVRSNGLPVYNFCCVVDDWKMEISHVIRGEDHLTNTLRQLMVYEALGAQRPKFAHVSLLIGKDRQKLSKRHGATSLKFYKDAHYMPSAINNYLSLLGWSHPEEKDIFDLQELIRVFDLSRFSKSPAIYDPDKFQWVNGQHIKMLDFEDFSPLASAFIPQDHLYWKMSETWQKSAFELLKSQVELFSQYPEILGQTLFCAEGKDHGEQQEILSWETTPVVAKEWKKTLNVVPANTDFLPEDDFRQTLEVLKNEHKIKGKKLFKATRLALTGQDQGPELKDFVTLIPIATLKAHVARVLG